jgi:hypothetical protein
MKIKSAIFQLYHHQHLHIRTDTSSVITTAIFIGTSFTFTIITSISPSGTALDKVRVLQEALPGPHRGSHRP